MLVSVFRTSGTGCDPPCKDAVLDSIDEWGNHDWKVEIGSLEDLIALVREYGDFVVSAGYEEGDADAPITLEIYDYYRE